MSVDFNTNDPMRDAERQLHDMKVSAFEHESLEIDAEVITENMRKLPGEVAYWNSQFAFKQAEFKRATQSRHQLRARLRQELRVKLGKPTETAIADALELDERYIAAEEACIVAETAMCRAEAWAKGMEAKRNMLMSLGGFARDEANAFPR